MPLLPEASKNGSNLRESEYEHPCSTGKENGTASEFTGQSPRGGGTKKQARTGTSQGYWASQSSLAFPAVYANRWQCMRGISR